MARDHATLGIRMRSRMFRHECTLTTRSHDLLRNFLLAHTSKRIIAIKIAISEAAMERTSSIADARNALSVVVREARRPATQQGKSVAAIVSTRDHEHVASQRSTVANAIVKFRRLHAPNLDDEQWLPDTMP